MDVLAWNGFGLLALIFGVLAGTAVTGVRRGANHELARQGFMGLALAVLCCVVGWYLRRGAEDSSFLFITLMITVPIGFLVGLTAGGATADVGRDPDS